MRPAAAPPSPPSPFRQFPRLLCEKAAGSGILTASRGRLKRLFCLEKGWVVYATSNLLEEQYAEYLVRSGILTPDQRAHAVETAALKKISVAAVLLDAGRPSPESLRRAMDGLIRELLTSTLEWPDGAFSFEDGAPKLDGEVTARLAIRPFVIAHAKRHPASLDALRIRIGPPDLRPVVPPKAAASAGDMDALGTYLLEHCDGSRDLAELVKGSPAEEEPTLRLIYGLLLAGWLEPEDPKIRRSRELKTEATITREEALGRLSLATGQDHYGVLGLDRTARPDAIRESYYALARRYHPDRFRSGSLADLLPRFEEFFTHVTEAYNTLSDAEGRAEYDQMLLSAHTDTDRKGADTGGYARQNYLRGRALIAQRKLNEGITFLENAVQIDPSHAEYHLELGLALAKNPRHREAAEIRLLQAIELAPTSVAAYLALSQMYLKAGRPGRAVRMAKEALRWEPGHLEAQEVIVQAGSAATDDRDDLKRAIFGGS
ncbi:MAG TPA: DnaJ domain-containing protein [Candidatus Polarisedimenticolaceae bacterium]|nr:DnaJ domain-containing protein [Candidatus Polarisedimenticolaceae bacterium]